VTDKALPASPSTDKAANVPVKAATQGCAEKRVIVIDPGHGGDHDADRSSRNNAVSPSGVLEKNLTLAYAKSLKASLLSAEVKQVFQAKNYCDVQVILTRETDVNLAASDRIAVATSNKADIMISIHFNGGKGSIRGAEAFYRATSNKFQTNEAEDRELATVAHAALYGAIKKIDSGAPNRNVKPDTSTGPKSIFILRDPGIGLSGKMCRSMLTEIEYISHPKVEELLVSGPNATANRDSLMLAVARALARAL
jgi:N-acetylmuramoyl-L-alanine amidase